MDIEQTLSHLSEAGNFRRIPPEFTGDIVDLSSNDYLGISERSDLREEFFCEHSLASLPMSASASRLLGAHQRAYNSFENFLSECYGRGALLFNSGYHANVGIIQALADNHTLVVADRLVHASIIDGIRLSGMRFERFRHNDYQHLNRIIDSRSSYFENIIIIAESVYSMDGDAADIEQLIEAKRRSKCNTLLYIDEAHAVGVVGPSGLGLVAACSAPSEVDIMIGTLGKALASVGAYAILSPVMRDFMVNKARSLIFSTALPPLNVAWSEFVFRKMLDMDNERASLQSVAIGLADILHADEPSHIRPLIIGDSHRAINISEQLLAFGYKVLPIRTPTVPPGTERLRFSLSAAIMPEQISGLRTAIDKVIKSEVGYEA